MHVFDKVLICHCELGILLPQLSECWDLKDEPLVQDFLKIFLIMGMYAFLHGASARERRILQRSEVSALKVEAQVAVTSVGAGD